MRKVEPFKTVLSGNRQAMAKFSMQDLEKILAATLTGMSVDEFQAEAKTVARHGEGYALEAAVHRSHLPADAGGSAIPARQRLQDLHRDRRRPGFRACLRERVYGIPPEQVVGTAGGTKYGYGKDGKPFLTKEPKLLLNDNYAGKPEGIHLMIGRRPHAAFGNSTGDRQMLEYTGAGDGARLMMLVLHDDAKREYTYGPAEGLPDTRVGTFTQSLYDEAKARGWVVISMKKDWQKIFAWE